MSVYQWSCKKLTPPSANATNTPLSVKHAWKTEQPTSAFPVWRRQSEQCFLTGELQALHILIQTQLFLHQQIRVPKILLSLAVVCQITSFLPTYAQCFQYYLKCQAGGLACQRHEKSNHYNHQAFRAV